MAANRDEFYDRPARQAYVWDTEPEIVAGKDLKAGGTWLGISKKGDFGAITNYRDLHRPQTGERSRGEIIPDFLTKQGDPEKKISALMNRQSEYNGFNLLAGNLNSLFYVSNIHKDYKAVDPGLHGISNAFLDTSWPKVNKAKRDLKELISSTEIDEEKIFQLLQNDETYPENELPKTGLSTEMEKKVSPIFIKTETYGTRCSSLLIIDKQGEVSFTEKTYNRGKQYGEGVKRLNFSIPINSQRI